MVIVKKLIPLLLLSALLSGCGTTITSLSPKRVLRNPSNLYTLEAALDSKQQSLRWSSIKPAVVIDNVAYPMRQTALMTNRWETVVPLPSSEKVVFYRFKFDFTYNSFGAPPSPDSAMSKMYRMQILDK